MDIIFQAIFGEVGSENITKDFLEKNIKKENRKDIIRTKIQY